MILGKLGVAETATHNLLKIMQLVLSKLWVVYAVLNIVYMVSCALQEK